MGRLLPGPTSLPGKIVAFWTSRPLLLALVFGLITAGFAFGGMKALSWMETPEFCGRCHTMQPEVNAHLNTPHETVECAECHVGSGVMGLIKSKISGMRQMIKLVLGDYARPIPPAAHGMPPAKETCLRCHDPGRQRQDVLITRSHFQEDEANTRQRVALVVRLSGDADQQTRGIHWHVLSKVEYVAKDEDGRVIDWIGVQRPDGTPGPGRPGHHRPGELLPPGLPLPLPGRAGPSCAIPGGRGRAVHADLRAGDGSVPGELPQLPGTYRLRRLFPQI